MRIAIDASAANDAECHQWLDRILAKIEDRWHVWDLTDDREVKAIGTSTWCLDPGRQGVKVKEMLVAATIKRSSPTVSETMCTSAGVSRPWRPPTSSVPADRAILNTASR